jgi:predicted Fe-S protein YdhL (DUF1289 family)
MKDLLKERELSIKNIDVIFRNLKSPEKITALHSTYGTDVLCLSCFRTKEEAPWWGGLTP